MANPPVNPNVQPQLHSPSQGSRIQRLAMSFADFVRAAIIILAWGVLGFAALAAAFVAARAIYFAVTEIVLPALGI